MKYFDGKFVWDILIETFIDQFLISNITVKTKNIKIIINENQKLFIIRKKSIVKERIAKQGLFRAQNLPKS